MSTMTTDELDQLKKAIIRSLTRLSPTSTGEPPPKGELNTSITAEGFVVEAKFGSGGAFWSLKTSPPASSEQTAVVSLAGWIQHHVREQQRYVAEQLSPFVTLVDKEVLLATSGESSLVAAETPSDSKT